MDRAAQKPRFSVVIPAYDRQAIIGRAIESVLAQTRAADEIIVVDDGSSDETAEVIRSFGDRVRLIRQDNAGASAARNRGVDEAMHEWIAFLDSDDYWQPTHLARMEAAIVGTGGAAGFYFADLRRTPERGSLLLWDVSGFEPVKPFEIIDDATDWVMTPVQPMMLQASVFRRDVYLELEGLSVDLACRHDTHLFFKASIGRPACAVSGCGTVQTSDDESGGRVTAAFGSQGVSYWEETRLLYEDVLLRLPTGSAEHRREVVRRLGSSHLQLARRAWDRGEWMQTASHLCRAAVASPRRFFGGLRSVATRHATE